MRKWMLVLPITALFSVSIMLAGCAGGGAVGTLQFYANGEDFARQGFVSKDGWSINFDHVYITLADVAACQTDPPYDPHLDRDMNCAVKVSLDNVYTVDLAEGDENAPPILVGEVSDAPVGHFNAISWKKVKASSGPAAGCSLVMIGAAEKDGQALETGVSAVPDGKRFATEKRPGVVVFAQGADVVEVRPAPLGRGRHWGFGYRRWIGPGGINRQAAAAKILVRPPGLEPLLGFLPVFFIKQCHAGP